ncbi:MAG: family efflux transporter permease subunit [Candidatus Acidoferrum typicum]|nr:family efflux transporter permease subunit [Candidatus Acidoferrum typicum]
MRAPCDETLIQSGSAAAPCKPEAGPWILAATILGSSMAFIDGTVVNVAVPTLQKAFHANVVDVQWVIESYGIFLSSLILAGGALGDLFGRRRMFLLGVAVFAAASAACGLAPSIEALVIARSIQGVGAALLVPGSLSIIGASFDEKSRGQAIGTWSGFTSITTALGPVLGGWLIEHGSWRWAFFLNVPLAAAVVVISLWRVPESRNSSVARIDWLGALLATAGLGGVVTAFLESAKLGWSNPLVFGSFLAGVACLVIFVLVEAHLSSPMLPLALFNSRAFSGANLITLFLYAAIGIFFFLFPMNLIQLHGYSTTATGAALLPVILLMFFLSRWSGGLVNHYGARIPLIIGPLIGSAGFLLFALHPAKGSYWTTFFPATLVLGLGMAVTVAPLTIVVMCSVDQDHVGAASGINNAVARVAGVLAIAVLGIVMVKAFGSQLDQTLAKLSLPPDVVQNIRSKQIELAGLELPKGLDPNTVDMLRRAIANAFLSSFRLVMFLCAALSTASAIVAWRLIAPDEVASARSS